ncbi:hypothetical protein [Persicitalea jodogahamensis]|uniref:Uncharacterized protein n=1 Tax=Persicitalea jodogahamensis TaxID=402147 RepID=A0A8J3DAM2_9BACT|nr:hypothetical protein [Persicitalea jodogahamensis]GHB76467.1 hypothetical protein GCM10007390_33000 [Persicitalea jodogahamensis]
MNTNPAFFKSKGGGQYFKREGERVKIVCLYEFNPSVERTTYDDKLLSALECTPCDEASFNDAQEQVIRILQLGEAGWAAQRA